MTYADTSALAKLLIDEAETTPLRSALSTLPDRLASSELTAAELSRTARRAGASVTAVATILAQLDLLAVDRAVLTRAGQLPSPPETFLRTADAIHLVTAMELGETRILTYDRRQAQAVAERGFTVLSPGRGDGWFQPTV